MKKLLAFSLLFIFLLPIATDAQKKKSKDHKSEEILEKNKTPTYTQFVKKRPKQTMDYLKSTKTKKLFSMKFRNLI
jgi:hypothetical protein